MRPSATSIAGLTGLPVAAIALIALIPMTSARSTPPAAPAPEGAQPVGPTRYSASADAVSGFHVGRTLLEEARGPEDRVRTLLVLLPDPEASSLDFVYDAHLSALRQSLEAAGFIGDRMWFPDPATTVPGPDALKTPRPAPQVFPGVMLFRRAETSPSEPGDTAGATTQELLVVYVVGELPTSGVHMPAMRAALDEAAELDTLTLRILGPTFSGSFPSLRLSLERWNPDRCGMTVRVVTGAATSASGRRIMRELGGVPCGGAGPGGTLPLAFAATVHTDDDYVAVLDSLVLKPLGLDSTDVALLTEASTAYGRQRSDEKAQNTEAARDRGLLEGALRIPFPLNVGTVRTAYERNPLAEGPDAGVPKPTARLPLSLHLEPRPLQLPPPRSRLTPPTVDELLSDAMATLRAQHVRAVGIMATDVRDKLFLAQLVRRELPDVFLFTLEGNALFARRDLSHTLRGMVVVSTYPLIRQNAVWLRSRDFGGFPMDGAAGVFNAAALLMDRPELVQQYRAPLDTPIQACVKGWSKRILGWFGAPDSVSDSCPESGNSIVAHLPTADSTEARPPVWLTVVGSGALLPLAVSDGPADSALAAARTGYTDLTNAEFRPGLLDGVAVVLGGLLSLLVLLVPFLIFVLVVRAIFAAFRSNSKPARASSRVTSHLSKLRPAGLSVTAWRRVSKPPQAEGSGPTALREQLERAWSFGDGMAVLVAIFACLAPLAVLNGIAAPWSMPKPTLGFGLALLPALAVLEVILAVQFAYLLGSGWSLKSSGPGGWVTLLTTLLPHGLTLILGALGIRYCFQILKLAGTWPVEYGLYRLHTLRLDSGVSGLLPFLVGALGAVLLVLWHRDRRALLSEARTPRFAALGPQMEASPIRDAWTRSFQSAGGAMQRIRGSLDLCIGAGWVSLFIGAIVVIAALLWMVYGGLSFRTLEDVTFGVRWLATPTLVLWIALAFGFLGLVVTLLHILALWDGLRHFLGALAETPIGAAFSRIPPRLRALGRLHLFDPSSARLGDVLSEAGHESLWEEALGMDNSVLQELGIHRDEVNAMVIDLHGIDGARERLRSQERLLRSLRRAWARRPNLVWVAGQDEKGGKPDADDTMGKWLRHVEDVFAIEGAMYVGWVLRHLRRITLLLLGLILFTTAMLEVIPFPFHSALTGLFIVMVMGGVGLVLAVMVQLAQDDVLSRINGTEPGKLNFSGASLMTALVVVALPVFSLLGTEVAPIGQTLFGWVTELLKVLSGG